MLDPDTPPAVEEGEADGVVGVVHQTAAHNQAAIVNSTAEFTLRRWITVIARRWAEIKDRAAGCGQVLRPPTLPPSQSHCRSAMTPLHAFLHLWTTCSSRQRFRKQHAN